MVAVRSVDHAKAVIEEIFTRIKGAPGSELKTNTAIYERSGIGYGEVSRAKKGGSFSKPARDALLALLPHASDRAELGERLVESLTSRRQSQIRANAADTPLELLRDGRLQWENWAPRAFALLDANSLPLHFPSGSDARDVYAKLVDEKRSREGEEVAFRNALLLMGLRLSENRLGDCEQDLTALNAVWVAYDLAAQFGNPLWLKFIGQTLRDNFSGLRTASALLLHKRMRLECEALALTYTRNASDPFKHIEKADGLFGDAAAIARAGLEERGVAETWKSMFAGWGGVFVNRINGSVALKRPFVVQKALFADYDRALVFLQRDASETVLPGDLLDGGLPTNMYLADTLAGVDFARDDPLDDRKPPSLKSRVHLDLAMRRIDTALGARTESDKSAETIVAALHLDKGEAILRTWRHAWTQDSRDAYQKEKDAAANIFTPLGMRRKLGRMTRLEQATGYRSRK